MTSVRNQPNTVDGDILTAVDGGGGVGGHKEKKMDDGGDGDDDDVPPVCVSVCVCICDKLSGRITRDLSHQKPVNMAKENITINVVINRKTPVHLFHIRNHFVHSQVCPFELGTSVVDEIEENDTKDIDREKNKMTPPISYTSCRLNSSNDTLRFNHTMYTSRVSYSA